MSAVLSVVAHPSAGSFSKAVSAAVLSGAASRGAATEEADLYRNGFDPRLSLGDWERFQAGGVGEAPADVRAEQGRLLAADGIAFVFPVHWWSVPAYLKGYIDRVITRGFAYGHDADGQSVRRLAGKRVRLLALTASPQSHYDAEGLADAMDAQLAKGVFQSYCGVADVRLDFLWEVTKTTPGDAASKALLEQASGVGVELAR